MLIRWTVRISVAFYLAFALGKLSSLQYSLPHSLKNSLKNSLQWKPATMRWLWTLGWIFFVMHLIAAFALFHDWSHASAIEHTAEQTSELIGLRWGGGVYFNYVFAAMWTIDVVMWWSTGISWPQKYPWYQVMLHGFFAFIVFNATVVFGPVFWRYAAIGLVIVLVVRLLAQRLRSGRTPE